jgi:hypothetical protein
VNFEFTDSDENMIGRYYDSWGSKHQIIYRYGDNRGFPFQGPVQLSYLEDTRIFVLGKNQIISLQNTLGGIEFHLCSDKEQEKFEDQLIDADINDADWQTKFLTTENNQRIKTFTVYADIQPIAITNLFHSDLLYILDERNLVKTYDLSKRSIVHSFGKSGMEKGEFSSVSAITSFQISGKPLLMIGDSGGNQKVHFYTAEGEFLTSVGSRGPLLGQFRDIPSLAVYLPEYLTDTATDIDFYTREYKPSWYKGRKHSDEELRDLLAADDQLNNFVIAQDDKDKSLFYIYFINHEKKVMKYSIRYGTISVKPVMAAPSRPTLIQQKSVNFQNNNGNNNNNDNNNNKPTTPKSALRRIDSSLKEKRAKRSSLNEKKDEEKEGKEEKKSNHNEKASNGGGKGEGTRKSQPMNDVLLKTGYYLVEPERHDDGGEKGAIRVFDSLFDLVKYRKDLFVLKEETRDFFHVAVVDRKNFRVQICHVYWTKSVMYAPLIAPKFEIGGTKNRFFSLSDPVAVAYSGGGELAICDNGKSSVVLLTPYNYEVIKVIQTSYLSTRELQLELQKNKHEEEADSQQKKKDIEETGWNPEISASTDGGSRTLKRSNTQKQLLNKKSYQLTALELENTKKSCTIAFNHAGNLALGFKSGGKPAVIVFILFC